jgi:hypothetical protein
MLPRGLELIADQPKVQEEDPEIILCAGWIELSLVA